MALERIFDTKCGIAPFLENSQVCSEARSESLTEQQCWVVVMTIIQVMEPSYVQQLDGFTPILIGSQGTFLSYDP